MVRFFVMRRNRSIFALVGLVGIGCGDSSIELKEKPEEARGQRSEPIQNGKPISPGSADQLGLVSIKPIVWEMFRGKPRKKASLNSSKCSGQVFKKKWIITAQHCFVSDYWDVPPGTEVNKLGAQIFDASGKVFDQSYKVYRHPIFDLAIVELSKEYPYDSNVAITLADASFFEFFYSKRLKCMGWAGIVKDAPTSAAFLIDKNPKKTDFVEQKKLGIFDSWESSCYGSERFFGKSCAITLLLGTHFSCTDSVYFSNHPECLNRPYPVGGDSGGPCFEDEEVGSSRILLAVNQAIATDSRIKPDGTTIKNNSVGFHTAIASGWTWMSELGLLSPISKPQTPAIPYPTPSSVVAEHLVADVNNDSRQDLISISNSTVEVRLSDGASWGAVQKTSFPNVDPSSVFMDYVSYDADLDLAWIKGNEFHMKSFLGFSGNLFQGLSPETIYNLPAIPGETWDGNNTFLVSLPPPVDQLVLVRVDSQYLRIAPWDNNLGFSSFNLISAPLELCGLGSCKNSWFDFTDMNNDGYPDFVAFAEGKIYLKKSFSDASLGSFEPISLYSILQDCGEKSKKVVMDTNGDGLKDYVCVDKFGIRTWLYTGEKFQEVPQISPFDAVRDWEVNAQFVDVDLDGSLDIISSFRLRTPKKILNKFTAEDGGYFIYKLSNKNGTFGESQFVQISSSVVQDSVYETLILGIPHLIDDQKGIDLVVVGNKNIWVQKDIIQPKIFL